MIEKKKRVYFIGSGPSIAMGIPSVENLFDTIMSCLESPRNALGMYSGDRFWGDINKITAAAFPNLSRNKINFEELLTILDETGIAPEIYKIRRISEEDFRGVLNSIGDLYKNLLTLTFEILLERMLEPKLWSEYRFQLDDVRVKKANSGKLDPEDIELELAVSKRTELLFKIKKKWWDQYSKLNTGDVVSGNPGEVGNRDFVITTNYDLMIENALARRYSYIDSEFPKTLILKLHGSINWYDLQPNERIADEEILLFKENSRVAAQHIHLEDMKNPPYPREAVISPPITLKKYENPLFKQMFWKASDVLANANELVILGYGFSNYDFFVKKLMDFAINSTESRIENIYHFDNNPDLEDFFKGNKNKRMDAFIRKGNIDERYHFKTVDFSTHVPNFEDISGAALPIFA